MNRVSMILLKFLACICLLHSTDIFAKTLQFIPGKTAFGVSLKAPQTEFERVLGNPDGIIKMGPNRVGLLYGQNLLLMFWDGKLWELQTWSGEPIDALLYVRNGREEDPPILVIDENIVLGASRSNVERVLRPKETDSDGDEFAEQFILGDTSIFVGYEYSKDLTIENQVVNFLRVTLPRKEK